jgi:hypothetical protein
LSDSARLNRRPSAWWSHESLPERTRRKLRGDGVLLTERFPAMTEVLDCGVPLYDGGTVEYEAQAAYLARHNLLLPVEQRALSRSRATGSAVRDLAGDTPC